MAFLPVNLTLWSNAQNPNTPRNLPQWWGYLTTVDNVATVSTNGYFNIDPNTLLQNTTFRIGDLLYCICSDSTVELEITALTPNITTVTNAINVGPNSVNTAAIQNLAVTAAKIALGAITTAQINAAAGILGTQLANGTLTTTQLNAAAGILGTQLANNTITATQIAANTITASQIVANGITGAALALNTIQYTQVAMTAAQWNAMSVTPFQILAAPGAGLIYQVDNVWYDMTFVTAQYANGGVVNLQYGNTATGAGISVTADTAAATITGLAASSIVRPGLSAVAMADANTVNAGLFMSNKTAPFITGDGTWKINVAYRIITA